MIRDLSHVSSLRQFIIQLLALCNYLCQEGYGLVAFVCLLVSRNTRDLFCEF